MGRLLAGVRRAAYRVSRVFYRVSRVFCRVFCRVFYRVYRAYRVFCRVYCVFGCVFETASIWDFSSLMHSTMRAIMLPYATLLNPCASS
jgi:hypothetical protein